MGVMLALMATLSALERMIPPIPFMPPSARLGLANVVVMCAALFLRGREAVALNALKALFVFLTRGYVAGALSLFGGVLSILAILFLLKAFKDKVSFVALSVCGSIAHNFGQALAFRLVAGAFPVFYYLPFLLIFGAAFGVVTGVVLKVVMPAVRGSRWLK
jgi:heptaprenyl diphosphate synthase